MSGRRGTASLFHDVSKMYLLPSLRPKTLEEIARQPDKTESLAKREAEQLNKVPLPDLSTMLDSSLCFLILVLNASEPPEIFPRESIPFRQLRRLVSAKAGWMLCNIL